MDDTTLLEQSWLKKHTKSATEEAYTSTGSKLLHHPDRLKEFRDNDNPTPIVMHIMPTDICNFQCTFCSVGNRNGYDNAKQIPNSKPDVLQLSQIKHVVDKLAALGLKGVILSGGGEPTIYNDDEGNNFGDLIRYLKSKDLEVGLITNGSMLNRWEKEIAQLTWIRISLYPPQYSIDAVHLPKNIPSNVTVGFSWVLAYPDGADPATTPESAILDKYEKFAESVKQFAIKNNATYVRLVPDSHTYDNGFIKIHNVIGQLVEKFGEPFFHQHKSHSPPENCYLGYFHPVFYPDGKIYPCDSLILNDSDSVTGRKFKQDYAMCDWNDVEKVYSKDKINSLIQDPKTMCPKCVFGSNNDLLTDVYEGKMEILENPAGNVVHKNFI